MTNREKCRVIIKSERPVKVCLYLPYLHLPVIMDYYATLRNDYIHKAMYPEDPMRVDFIPKGPPTGTLTIKPKDRCPPKFVTKIEGSAVEESCKVFFEGIVDAQPQPKFSWYFNDEPITPGMTSYSQYIPPKILIFRSERL